MNAPPGQYEPAGQVAHAVLLAGKYVPALQVTLIREHPLVDVEEPLAVPFELYPVLQVHVDAVPPLDVEFAPHGLQLLPATWPPLI